MNFCLDFSKNVFFPAKRTESTLFIRTPLNECPSHPDHNSIEIRRFNSKPTKETIYKGNYLDRGFIGKRAKCDLMFLR